MNEVILIDKTTALHRAHFERNRLCSVFLCSRINIYEPEKGPKQYGNDLQRLTEASPAIFSLCVSILFVLNPAWYFPKARVQTMLSKEESSSTAAAVKNKMLLVLILISPNKSFFLNILHRWVFYVDVKMLRRFQSD